MWLLRRALVALALLDQPLWRTAGTGSFLTPVDRWLEPDGARGYIVGGGVSAADCAAQPPPGVHDHPAARIRCLEKNRTCRRPSFRECSAGFSAAQQTHDLRDVNPLAFAYRWK